MNTCATCGNEYDRSFEVTTAAGEQFTFDSIECAAHRIAPRCDHCGCQVLGHGVEVHGTIYCCAHCAPSSGGSDPVDRVGSPGSSGTT
ncbi:hypothetical protein KUV85_14235 [Nocardioides panacisoli]|uniref:hypothetical protein n=1 Tax=Nocardioides panacisoli TaxID=627624 RepID=UPI001C6271F1|nr:hypothetical protein [Nocardioides panacisoli]QYJ03476.1 hypothetical protein KUV85_14235 [Nocardioides panacisoli]